MLIHFHYFYSKIFSSFFQDFLVKSSKHKKQKASPNLAPLLKMTVFILVILLLSLFSFVFFLSFFFFFLLLLLLVNFVDSNGFSSMILLSSRNTETDSRHKFEIVLTQFRARTLKTIADKIMQKFQTVSSTSRVFTETKGGLEKEHD